MVKRFLVELKHPDAGQGVCVLGGGWILVPWSEGVLGGVVVGGGG